MLQGFFAKLSEKEKKVFYLAIFFVVVALVDRMFLGPATNKLKSLKEEIETQKISIEQDMRILSYKDQILKDNEQYASYFSEEIQDDDVVNADFLSTVEQLASSSKINLVKSNPSETRKSKKSVEYYANLECVGTLENVITFMHKINASDDLLKVVDFNMASKRGTANDVNASMTILKFVMIPKGEIAIEE